MKTNFKNDCKQSEVKADQETEQLMGREEKIIEIAGILRILGEDTGQSIASKERLNKLADWLIKEAEN